MVALLELLDLLNLILIKNKNEIILKRSIKKIEKLHQYCWHDLSNKDKNNLKQLPVHYSLKYSFKKKIR